MLCPALAWTNCLHPLEEYLLGHDGVEDPYLSNVYALGRDGVLAGISALLSRCRNNACFGMKRLRSWEDRKTCNSI